MEMVWQERQDPNGATNLYFNYAEFAYFDIYILKREGAREEWAGFEMRNEKGEVINRNVLQECDELAKTMTPLRFSACRA